MWKCQLCQRDFENEEFKYEILTSELQKAFQGVVELKTSAITLYLCEECFQEYKKITLEEV